MNAGFPKAEHLCSQRVIDRLYDEGYHLKAYPYAVQWMVVSESSVPCQVMIVAPKRKFHHAVDRNRVRRLTRECYRLHKQQLLPYLQEHGLHIALSLVYIHNEIMTYDHLCHKFDKLLSALQRDIDEKLGL